MNCQSIRNKRSELHASLNYIKPDIVCATETWLRGIKPGKSPASDCISSSEFTPDDYNIFRNDRSTIGGGVLIMAHKSLTVEEQPHLVTDCELNWIKVKLKNLKDLYVGVFYMPHRNAKAINELNKSLDLLSKAGAKDTILAGDFNSPDIDWESHTVYSGAQDRELQHQLAEVMSSSSLTQVHNQPTRLSALLDLTFTSNPSLMKNSSSVPGLSDHDMVVTDFETKPQTSKENPRTYYKFRKANWERIKNDLTLLLTDITNDYENGKNVEILWTKFKNALKETIDKNIPSGTAKKRTRLPWIGNPLLKELKKKKRLYRKAKQSKNWIRYKAQQKLCKRELRKAEWKYINSTIEDGLRENNTKPFWNFIKARRRDNIGVSPLKEGGKLFSDPVTKARILLTQFKSVFTIDDGTQLPSMPSSYPSCPKIEITTPGVTKLLRNLKPGKAPGPDCLPNVVLKTCADHIAPILSLVYQRSIDSGELPVDWLSANISAAFKKGNRHLPENYRPISLTSIPCKILEHIICSHLHKHFENHKILTNLNHGFRSGFSCETQLLTTANDLLQSFDQNKQVDVAIFDFSKAFDTVPHQKLLHKLSSYGVHGTTLSWLTSFLTKRTMRVVLEGSASESTSVDSGVPQGTVLGPLLFLCHINDLPDSVTSKVRLFADDCLLYREINSIKDHISLKEDLKQLEVWAHTWGMRFNASKCYILSINRTSDEKITVPQPAEFYHLKTCQ